MKKTLFFFLLFLLPALAAGAQEAKFEKAVLKNGLTVIAREQKGDVSSACLFVKVKKTDEAADEKGLSDLLGRTLLSCDPLGKGVSPVLKIEQLGGSVSAEVSGEFTCFTLSVPLKNFIQALKVFSEVYIRPDFSGSALSREKEALQASWLRNSDRIEEKACRMLAVNGDGGPALPDVSRLGTESVSAWFSKYYRPSAMVLSICGTNASGALKAAGDAFGRFSPPEPPAQEKSVKGKASGVPASGTSGREKRAAVALGYGAPAAGSADYPVMLVAKALISSGMGSGMFSGLRDADGIAYLFGSRMACSVSDPGLVLFAVPGPGRGDAAIEKVLEAAEALREDEISEQELDRAKQYAAGELLMRESAQGLAWSAGYYETAGLGPDYDDTVLRVMSRTGRQDVARVARRYLDESSLVKLPAAEPVR